MKALTLKKIKADQYLVDDGCASVLLDVTCHFEARPIGDAIGQQLDRNASHESG